MCSPMVVHGFPSTLVRALVMLHTEKNVDSLPIALEKWKNRFFVARVEKTHTYRRFPSQGTRMCSTWPRSDKLYMYVRYNLTRLT
jgi:hypothetical protein